VGPPRRTFPSSSPAWPIYQSPVVDSLGGAASPKSPRVGAHSLTAHLPPPRVSVPPSASSLPNLPSPPPRPRSLLHYTSPPKRLLPSQRRRSDLRDRPLARWRRALGEGASSPSLPSAFPRRCRGLAVNTVAGRRYSGQTCAGALRWRSSALIQAHADGAFRIDFDVFFLFSPLTFSGSRLQATAHRPWIWLLHVWMLLGYLCYVQHQREATDAAPNLSANVFRCSFTFLIYSCQARKIDSSSPRIFLRCKPN